jgi:hypothetical protein
MVMDFLKVVDFIGESEHPRQQMLAATGIK